eukprot:19761_1
MRELDYESKHESETELYNNQSIRYKRKCAAILLLNLHIDRNLNYIKHLLYSSLGNLVEKAVEKNDIDSAEEKRMYDIINDTTKQENEESIKEFEDSNDRKLKQIESFIQRRIQNVNFWKSQKPEPDSRPDLENLKYLNINKYQLPLLHQFMIHCFIEPDRKMFERNSQMKAHQSYFYKVFIDSWRNVPDFWKYKHDILLIELVLRNGINSQAIIEDIQQSTHQYKQRLNISERLLFGNNTSINHPLYAFQTWCKLETNILHRLKYVTKTIVDTLNVGSNFIPNTIFSPYQKEGHLEFINRKDYVLPRVTKVRRHTIARDTRPQKRKVVKIDRYIARNIENELFESLQSFDLMKYGGVLTRFMIDKLNREAEEPHYFVLGQLFYSLPDPVALQILWESIDALQMTKPDKLKNLCLKLHAGSIFKPSTDLCIAEFFYSLSKKDLVQTDLWDSYSKEFEQMAFDNVGEIESNHMMYALLLLPLPHHEGRCLIQLAIEGSMVSFLNSERVSYIINHMYRVGKLKPDELMQTRPAQFSDMLNMLVFYPFRFYLSPQGYHWVTCVLYAEYLLLLFAYAYWWPILPELQTNNFYETLFSKALQVLFWGSNLCFVSFEFYQYFETGAEHYFFLTQEMSNLMDVLICVIWIVLFGLRMAFLIPGHTYKFLFGIQIFLITIRSLNIFNNSQYFAPLV